MYRSWLTRLLLALALAGMPLQGIAETLSAVFCVPHMHGTGVEIEHAHAHANHQHDLHPHGAMHQESDASDVGGAQGSADHACCPIVVSGLPPSAEIMAMPKLIERALAPEISRYCVFLKLPQRPPLA
jgi:hypothetical protein